MILQFRCDKFSTHLTIYVGLCGKSFDTFFSVMMSNGHFYWHWNYGFFIRYLPVVIHSNKMIAL